MHKGKCNNKNKRHSHSLSKSKSKVGSGKKYKKRSQSINKRKKKNKSRISKSIMFRKSKSMSSKTKKKSRNKSHKKKPTKKILQYNKKGGYMKTCDCIDYNIVNNKYSLAHNPTAKKCEHKSDGDSHFCSKHKNCKNFLKTYTSGYEHKYDPENWKHPYVEGSHNCYTYFLNTQNKAVKERCDELCKKYNKEGCPKKVGECSNLKPQPGDYHQLLTAGNLNKGPNNYSCPLMEKRIFNDNEMLKKVRYDQKCPKYHYKGAMVVDPGHTYHFYRQNEDGTWSHKPGTLPVTDKDANDKVIYVPHTADRNYNKEDKKGGINYTDFCGYYCIPNNKYINTHAI